MVGVYHNMTETAIALLLSCFRQMRLDKTPPGLYTGARCFRIISG